LVQPTKVDGVPIIPREVLCDDDWRVRNRWLRDNGFDPTNVREMHPILDASWAAHGIEPADRKRVVIGSLERARLRAEREDGDQ